MILSDIRLFMSCALGMKVQLLFIHGSLAYGSTNKLTFICCQ